MFKNLIMKNQILFDDKINLCVFRFCRYLSSDLSTNYKISEFESFIDSEKIKAKNYFLIEDKCNVLSKLNTENVSQLLETKVNNVFKWSFNEKNCALIELKDSNYLLKRDIRLRSFGLHSEFQKSSINVSRYIALNSCPKVLNSSSTVSREDNHIHRLSPRNKDSLYLNVNYLKQNFQTNEELIQFLLYDKTVSDLDLKIRFLIISQLERYICQPYFKDYQILPFGSSIAGLATPNSDLDLVLIPKQLSESKSKFEDRQRLKSNLNLIADLLETSVPFYSHFLRILKARIPIIKFAFDLAPIDIDLSIELSPYSVHHGVYMSAFLNYCIHLNPQIRDLIVLLRIWAKQHNLLKPKNTNMIYNGFTSFQLTSLVIFFLQNQGLVPPMNDFLNNQIFKASKRQIDLIQLLSEFFDFVLKIRFEWEAISILYGKTFSIPDSSAAIYMENPFDITLNMCRNINRVKFTKFLDVTNNCADIMRTKNFSLADIFVSDVHLTNSHKRFRVRAEDLFSDS